MLKTYECYGLIPLSFPDGQQVETGEMFTRDFEKTTGLVHEHFLINTGQIRRVELPPVTTPVAVPVASPVAKLVGKEKK